MSFCGIDFGTSNSALSFVAEGGVAEDSVVLAPVEGGQVTLPSAIFYPARGQACFGRAAMQGFIDGQEGRFMRSLKRILGTSLMGQGTVVNGRVRKFDDILADFLRAMKDAAERHRGARLDHVVMGRPVHFADHDPDVDARAQDELARIARSVGFSGVAFQYEPIAAAFAHERHVEGEKLAMVADIGGGTSDFTVIRLSRAYMGKPDRQQDILANSGIRTGGNDFDKGLCLSSFMPHMGYGTTYGEKSLTLPVTPFHEMSEWSRINFLYNQKTRAMIDALLYDSHAPQVFGRFAHILHEESGHRVLAAVEDAKIALTTQPAASAPLGFVEAGLAIDIARAGFDAATARHVDDIANAAQECLIQSSVGAEAIDIVILTGGTTEVPAVRDALRRLFPHAAVSDSDKLSSVALGLGYDARRVFGAV